MYVVMTECSKTQIRLTGLNWYKCCESFAVLCEREPIFSYLFSHNFFVFLSLQFSNIKKNSSVFSQGLKGTQS